MTIRLYSAFSVYTLASGVSPPNTTGSTMGAQPMAGTPSTRTDGFAPPRGLGVFRKRSPLPPFTPRWNKKKKRMGRLKVKAIPHMPQPPQAAAFHMPTHPQRRECNKHNSCFQTNGE